jgi:hypothetical protein
MRENHLWKYRYKRGTTVKLEKYYRKSAINYHNVDSLSSFVMNFTTLRLKFKQVLWAFSTNTSYFKSRFFGLCNAYH